MWEGEFNGWEGEFNGGKIKELYTMQETLNKLQVAILAEYLHKIATYQELR